MFGDQGFAILGFLVIGFVLALVPVPNAERSFLYGVTVTDAMPAGVVPIPTE